MLKIKKLEASIEGSKILRGLDLEVKAGEVHAIMGPNGSGKSTLANVLAGREEYEIDSGEVSYDGKDLLEMSAEERAQKGVFMAFQYPVEIPGVNIGNFMKTAINAIREHRGEEQIDSMEFLAFMKEKMSLVGMEKKFLNRSVNEGFFWWRKEAK